MEEHSHSHFHSRSRSNVDDSTHMTYPPNYHVRDPNSDSVAGGSNGARYKLMSPAKLPISRSPCITIPPGLSPTSFLESPVLLSNIKLSELHQLMVEAAAVLKLEAPELYVRQSPVPNAYTLAVSGKKPFVVVHTSLVELLTRKELQAVLAHELGHLKCDHGVWLTVANILTLGAYTVPSK